MLAIYKLDNFSIYQVMNQDSIRANRQCRQLSRQCGFLSASSFASRFPYFFRVWQLNSFHYLKNVTCLSWTQLYPLHRNWSLTWTWYVLLVLRSNNNNNNNNDDNNNNNNNNFIIIIAAYSINLEKEVNLLRHWKIRMSLLTIERSHKWIISQNCEIVKRFTLHWQSLFSFIK